MKRRILIVEHDDKASALYGLWLTDLGFEVAYAINGLEAMRVIRSEPIDGLIVDLDVPGMDGFTLLLQLRQRFAEVPVMVLADVDATDALLEALERGAQDYLTKPASHSLFSQKCRRAFSSTQDSATGVDLPEASKPSGSMRILIIDDEDDLRFLLRSLLESHGYECEEARTGQEGLDKMISADYSVVLIDYQMPILNGVQVLRKVLSVPSRVLPPVIMMTANPSPTLHQEAIQAGVTQFLSKPFELDDILLAVGRAVKIYPSPSTCSQGPP